MIILSELQFYKSQVFDDTAANGGLMSDNVLIDGAVNNTFPNALQQELLDGVTKYRKIFAKVANDDDDTLLSTRFWLDIITPADDWFCFFPATQRNTQGDITGSERIYGCAALTSDASGSTIVCEVEDASLTGIIQDGDLLRITDKLNPNVSIGNEEFVTVSGAPSVSGTELTITIVETLANTYLVADVTRVMSVYEHGDIETTTDNWAETSGSGTYDESTFPVVMDNIGTIEQIWTITFADANSFTVSGDTVGPVASGNISANYEPQNAAWSKPYFTLAYLGFGGTWAAGDTIVFQTHPASPPLFEKRVIPAACSSLSGDKTVLVWRGEAV